MRHPLLMVIDGNALLHRAWHAIPPLSTPDGRVVNAAYGFTNILERLLDKYHPEYMTVAWDLPGGTFRHKAFAEYKAQRKEKEPELYAQIPIIQNILNAYGIKSLSAPGFEADDIIGTLSRRFSAANLYCVIVTGDKDAFQLIDDNTHVLSFVKGVSQTTIYDAAAVQERYQLSPAQMIDYKILVGDPSDNIPGFKGVGEKTATTLLHEYKTVENILVAAKDGLLASKFAKFFDRAGALDEAAALRHLVTIHDEVPNIPTTVSEFAYTPSSTDLVNTFADLDFKTLAAKYRTAEKNVPKAAPASVPKMIPGIILRQDAVWQEAKNLDAKNSVIALIEGENILVAVDKKFTRLSFKDAAQYLESKTIITPDAKALLRAIGSINSAQFFDLGIAAYTVDSSLRDFSLEHISEKFLKRSLPAEPTNQFENCEKLYTFLDARLKKDSLEKIRDLDFSLIPLLFEMEQTGILVDSNHLNKLSKEFEGELEKLTTKIYDLAGREFNINSPSQLAEILFTDLSLPTKGIKKTKSGFSTAAPELEKLWDMHEIIPLISEYRELSKLKSTYVDVLPTLADSEGRIHTTYNQTIAATGRLSSTDPNLQNIPIRTGLGNKIREAFVAAPGYTMMSADYSQFELRLVAEMGSDEEFISAFNDGADVHARTAARIFNKPESAITSDERRAAKAINFGILYGMGPRALARNTGFSQLDAKIFIDKYFAIHPGLVDYMARMKNQAHTLGYVNTIFGRRRYLPEVQGNIPMLIAAGERMAINMPVQGTQADLVKMAMLEVAAYIRAEAPAVRMLLQVHDELVFEIPDKEVATVVPRLKKIMEQVWPSRVPLVVNCRIGHSWGDLKEFAG